LLNTGRDPTLVVYFSSHAGSFSKTIPYKRERKILKACNYLSVIFFVKTKLLKFVSNAMLYLSVNKVPIYS